WTLDSRFKVGNHSIRIKEVNDESEVSALTLWCVHSNSTKAIEQAKDCPSDITRQNTYLVKFLEDQMSRKRVKEPENVPEDNYVRVSQVDMMPQICVRDPVDQRFAGKKMTDVVLFWQMLLMGTQLFKKVSDQKDNNQDTSKNTKLAKQPIAKILSKIGETNALSKPVTSNSVSTPPVSNGVNNAKVITPGMFRIYSDKFSREAKKLPNTVSESSRTKPITVSQPSVITKKDMNSNLNGLSSTELDNTKTRRSQPRSNTKNDRVLSASKNSRNKNKEVKVEEHHRKLLLYKKNKHILSACNSSKIDSQDVISKVVCAKCKKCLNSVNHDVCLNNCVNGKKSLGGKHKANVSKNETQKEYRPKISKSKNVGTRESLATPKPRKPRFLLRWSPTGKMFDSAGKLVAPSGDIACTSNTMEPKIKRFPNSTSLLGRLSRFVYGASTQVVPST
nr:hypothetical protein [Tanacetum cinerariifolium]